ncbi:putative guanine nucleotide exchange factor for Ras-like GTPases; N-terminal motif containing protein [Lyophyllum shimeji]|uniref:Guanine nucleotide exchange factor for Ras-like GTPases N-terminal motif containing protein n=1 Tax=Lyophyllum shimeji TaxID=47721 RepID=A0A9P3UIM4_LYOSH|nr:putative guanine nucleotide exchange factor for Ras-like GTPases; N-terminal motif containing protein [Lyophyllum shimeji]
MVAHGQSSLNSRQSLHVHIDPFTYKSEIRVSPHSPSPSSANPTLSAEATTPTSPQEGSIICSVLCMYDFRSDDPDHLSFYKNEILDIVRQEESGWWAAIRKDKDRVGWIPQAFVERISDEMAEKLRNTRRELRAFEYQAEQLYVSAPTEPVLSLYDSPEAMTPSPPSGGSQRRDGSALPYLSSKPHDLVHSSLDSDPSYRLTFQYLQNDRLNNSHIPPVLQPPHTSSVYSKPTPFISQEDLPQTRNRAGTLPITAANAKRRDDRPPPTRLRPLHESNNSTEVVDFPISRSKNPIEGLIKRTRSQRLKPSIGLDESPPPRPIQAWYLKPLYSDQLDVDAEGHIRYGTLQGLVEKLTCEDKPLDTQKRAEETLFRNIFLMTFRTFTTADVLFDMLVETYRMDHPKDLATAELEEWTGYLIETQRRVLMVFTMWLEDHRLLEHEPHIASKLTEFLRLIGAPPLAAMARLLQKSIQRLTFATHGVSPTTSPKRARRSRAHRNGLIRNDLIKLDPLDTAEQLTLLESKRYVKITPEDCLRHGSKKPSCEESALSIFCSTHDQVVAWVKASVLSNDALGKRADTIDFWIKVAEKCKAMSNFATMSAVINGLSSTVINRLHLTWAHVGRKTSLESLLRHNEPTGGFAGYRNLLQHVEGPCVPFISMFLTDLVHIQDHYADEGERICWLQRQRSYETVNAMLRYQARPYDFAESESTMNFITKHLQEESAKDSNWFWTRSQEVQQSELAHADIRKGLEAAGF